VLTITFDIGNPVTLTIIAVQTMINHAQLNPTTGSYDITYPANVQTTITWNDAANILNIQDNQSTPYTLLPADFILAGNLLTINQTYLATVLTNAGESILLTVNFNVGNPATLLINAIETVIVDAEINPTVAPFYINAPGNIKTVITWHDANNILSITDDQSTPYTLSGTDYTIDTDSLFIHAAYLTTVLQNVNDTIRLSIAFDEGNDALFKIYGSTLIGIADTPNNVFNIYPNPVQDNLIIYAHTDEIITLTIFNMNGQKVFEETHHAFPVNIDVSKYESGTYTVQLKNDTHIFNNKFIIIR